MQLFAGWQHLTLCLKQCANKTDDDDDDYDDDDYHERIIMIMMRMSSIFTMNKYSR